jgi:hypothetical protein
VVRSQFGRRFLQQLYPLGKGQITWDALKAAGIFRALDCDGLKEQCLSREAELHMGGCPVATHNRTLHHHKAAAAIQATQDSPAERNIFE